MCKKVKNNSLYSLWLKYQKAMWYLIQTGNELGKPLRFYSETALLLLLLDKFGFTMKPTQFIIMYLIIIIIAIIIGRFLAKIGTVKYNTTLANNHNNEFQEMIRRLKRIEEKMK